MSIIKKTIFGTFRDPCDSLQGFKYYLPQAARRHCFLTSICHCFVVLVFLFVSYFHLLTASDAESMVFTRNLPWIFENMSRLRSLGMLIIFTQMFKLDSYNSQHSQKSVLQYLTFHQMSGQVTTGVGLRYLGLLRMPQRSPM